MGGCLEFVVCIRLAVRGMGPRKRTPQLLHPAILLLGRLAPFQDDATRLKGKITETCAGREDK